MKQRPAAAKQGAGGDRPLRLNGDCEDIPTRLQFAREGIFPHIPVNTAYTQIITTTCLLCVHGGIRGCGLAAYFPDYCCARKFIGLMV